MLKKVTAVFSITFVIAANVLPFVSADECEMSCHQQKTTCCGVEIEQECMPTISECSVAVFIPIIVDPFTKFKHFTDYSKVISQNFEDSFTVNTSSNIFTACLLLSETPSTYRTPLRI